MTNEKVTQTATAIMGTVNAAIDETRVGWVVGGGLEYALGRNWSIRAEYLHLDFGTASGSGNIVVPAGVLGNVLCTTGQAVVTGPATITGCSISSRLTAEVVRAGITYRFDGRRGGRSILRSSAITVQRQFTVKPPDRIVVEDSCRRGDSEHRQLRYPCAVCLFYTSAETASERDKESEDLMLGKERHMKRVLGVTLGLLAISAVPAAAADLPRKAPIGTPMMATAFSWSGCYIGANAGWVGGRTAYNTAPSGAYLSAAGPLAPPNAAGTGLLARRLHLS